jgi:iron complex outermembrane recepter protein
LSARLPASESVTKLEDFVSPHIVSGTDQRVGDNMRYRRCGRTRSALLALVLSGVLSSAAVAQQKLNFDIPAQPAAVAIQSWAQQSGLQVFAAEDDLRGIRTNAVQGDFAPVEAAQRLIAGTGLEVVATGENTVTIRRVRPVGTAASSGDEKFSSLETEELMEVIVTGSRIRRPGFDTLQAAAVTEREEMERRAYTNVGQALEATPGFMQSDSSPVGLSQGNQSVGQTFVNLFGLGSQRTLTLVNGRRFVSSNSPVGNSSVAPGSQVDLNVIPAGLVERIETVAIGGAPVYGSDAIAGTVNVILKDDFEGIEATALYGVTDEDDAETTTYRLLMGGNFDEGRGNAVIGVEYNEQKGLLLADRQGLGQLRPNPANTSDTDGIPSSRIVENLRFGILTDGGLPLDGSLAAFGGNLPGLTIPGLYPNGNWVFDSSGNPLHFGPNGDLVPYDRGAVAEAVQGIPVRTSGGDGLDGARHTQLLAPTERTLINGMARYDIAPSVRVFVETSFAHTEGIERGELLAFTAPGLFGGPPLMFSATNPFLTQQARDILAANGLTEFQLNRNLSDVLDRSPGNTEIDLYRGVGGFEGDFGAFGDTWSWDVSYNYGRSRNSSSINYIIEERLLNAIDAVVDPNTGAIVCASAAANPDCVPINLFGENNFSDAAADYVSTVGRGISINTLQVLNANLSGRLPFGISERIAFNVGVERRRETASFDPDATQESGITLTGQNIAFQGIEGDFTTEEGYAELVAPVISPEQNLPIVKSLIVEGAARYVDHSLAGADTTWSAGGRFAPRLPGWGDGLMLRGVFTHAIRSPSVSELFLGTTPILVQITDICNAENFDEGNNPGVRAANCAAALAAVGGPAPQSFDETTDGASPAGTLSGNPNLDNETADSWSIGIVYQPTNLPRLRLAADWSDIELEGGIESLGIGELMAACYDSAEFPNVDACSSFRRLTAAEAAAQPGPTRTAGDLANGFRTGYINTSTISFAGLTLDAAYSFELPAGTLDVGARVFRLEEFNRLTFAGAELIESAGLVGAPDYRVNLNVGYGWRGLFVDLQARWTSSVTFDREATVEDRPFNEVGAYTLVNGTIGYSFTDKVSLQIAVSNLLGKEIPYEARVSGLVGSYDAIGRRYFATLRASF